MKDFIAKTDAMLNQAGIYRVKLGQVFEDSARIKAELNKTLGLTEETGFRKELPLGMSDADFDNLYPMAKEIFRNIPGWFGDWKPTSGKITVGKDKVNITKFLAKQLAAGLIPNHMFKYIYDLLKIDPKNPKADSQIVPKFGELITTKTNNVVVVSTNPFDFFTSSAQEFKYASFKSCFRPGGEYFNSCISLSRDGFSTISYKATTDRIDYKQGRAWMYLLEDIVAQTKSYGTFTTNERKLAREYAEHCLTVKNNFDPKTYKKHFVEKWRGAITKGVLYFDDYSIDLGYPKARFENFNDKMVPNIEFADSLCLKCGRETRYPQKGLCGVCSNNWSECKICKQELHNEITYHTVDGSYHCAKCCTEFFEKCDHCGNFHKKGSAVTASDGKNICAKCCAATYFKCDSCGQFHKKTVVSRHTITDMTQVWCQTCFAEKGFTCPDCGLNYSSAKAHAVNTHDNGEVKVCSGCITKYSTCMCCNLAFKGGYNTKDGDVCVVCYDQYDFCVHCDTFHRKEAMVFDGTKICCKNCATEAATYEGYLTEYAAIIADIQAYQEATKDTVQEAMNKLLEDRNANGYQIGDIVRVTGDTSWHGYKVCDLLTICNVVKNKNNVNAYLTFRGAEEWYLLGNDLEFARPAPIEGESFKNGNNICVIIAPHTINSEGCIYYSTDKGSLSSGSTIIFDGVMDSKAFSIPVPNYKVGELLLIERNNSHHPYNVGDKVKVIRIDKHAGITRFFVKKGSKFGCIYGVDTDAIKAPKTLNAKQVAAAKVAEYKEKTVKLKAPKSF